MGRYNKLIGSAVGGILGFGVSNFGLPEELASPEVVSLITMAASAAATYFFPANAVPVAKAAANAFRGGF